LSADVRHDNAADEILLGFANAVREAGVPVTADRTRAFLEAVACAGADRDTTRAAGRATLCGSPDDLDRFDAVFEVWFAARGVVPMPHRAQQQRAAGVVPTPDGGPGGEPDDDARSLASEVEVLRHRDVSHLSERERRRVAALFAELRVDPPVRRAHRRRPSSHGEVDAARTMRASLRRMGEPADIQWRRRGRQARRVVLLLDVSGSMSGYADAQLRLAHRVLAAGHRVEVFTLGTRLTHVTRALRQRDADRALVAAGQTVPDWSGGTRLGDTLKAFLDRRRDMARGAVVVVVSDGWERGSPDRLGEQMARLHRLAHKVVWANPHRGKDGYAPVQQGIAAALPHIDDFVAGHSLTAYQELLDVIARA